jgi:hypothetical protein
MYLYHFLNVITRQFYEALLFVSSEEEFGKDKSFFFRIGPSQLLEFTFAGEHSARLAMSMLRLVQG